jgi:translocation and assembly module TamB
MTQSPNSGNGQGHSNRRFWLLLLGRTSIALVVFLLVGIAVGAVWLRNFINEDLVPLVERNLNQLLGRPIELGEVENFSLNSLTFSSLTVPATATDPDRVAAEAVQVEFSPWEVLLNRTLELNVTLVQPRAYIEQAKNGNWVDIEIQAQEGEGFIQTELQTIRVQDGDVILVPNPRPGVPKGAVALDDVSGVARILPENQGISFDLSGEPTRGGAVEISGVAQLEKQQAELKIQAQNFPAADLSRLVDLPLRLQAGRVDGDLTLQLQLQPQQSEIAVNGTANITQVTADIENLPQKFTNATGNLTFQGQQVALNNVSANYGQIPLQANGRVGIDTGYNLVAQVKSVAAKNLLNTLNVDLPVPVAGQFQANLQVLGPIAKPILSGSGTNIKNVQVDRVNFKNVSTAFRLTTSGAVPEITFSKIRATPTVGGQIIGSGQIQLGTQPEAMFNVQAENVPANPIASAYGFSVPINIGEVQAKAEISGTPGGEQPLVVDFSQIQATPPAGGQITASGEVELSPQGEVNLNVQAQNLPGNALTQAYDVPVPINIGGISANAQVTGSVGGEQPLTANLSQVRVTPPAGGQITANGEVELSPQGEVSLNVLAQNLPGDALAKAYDVSVPISIGGISAKAQVSGSLGEQPLVVDFSQIQATPPVGGQITASGQVQLAPQGRVALDIQAQNVPADTIAKAYGASVPINLGDISAKAKVTGMLGNLQAAAQLQAPEATYPGTGQVTATQAGNIQFQDAVFKVAGGTVRARGQVAQGRWQAFVDAEQLQLSGFEQIPPQLQGTLNAEVNLSGITESFQPETIQARGQANLNVAGGRVSVPNLRLNNGRWQALANISQIELDRFSEQLRGQFSGDLQLAGTTSFQLEDIRAAGKVRLSQLAALEQPLTASVRWNGDQIVIQRATAPGLIADGTVGVELQETGTPQITGFNLDVQARDYNLQNLPFNLPANVALRGQVDFTGDVTGTPTTPNAVGDIQLRNLAINDLTFDPVLTGNVNFQGGQQTQLQLSGQQDQIAVTLGPNNRPTSFLIQIDDAVAKGTTEGENLIVNVQDFPATLLTNLVPGDRLNLQPLAGDLSGNLVINLADNLAESRVEGNVAIAQPRIGRVSADVFRGNISYVDGIATLTGGELQLGESNISLSGSLQPEGNRQFQVQINTDQARIQNILPALSVFGLEDLTPGLETPDLAGAEVIETVSVGLPNESLLTQLRRFAEVDNLLAQQRQQREEATRFPTLAELQGTFRGEISVTGSLEPGIQPAFSANFNITGSEWQWGQYDINQVIAEGSFNDGVLTLLPVRVELDEGLLAFTGQLGSDELSGQLSVESLPVSLLEPFLEELPVNVTGEVNALATVGGSLEDPSAIGEVTVVDATLNKQPVQTAQLSFNYNDARLNFGSTVLVTGTEPVEITGSIPVALPFAQEQPDSDQIAISATVENEGLALINLLTNQVTWQGGTGELDVAIEGTLNQPIITGNLSVNNATLQAQALPEPLTDVTGSLEFNGNRIVVESVEAQYNQNPLTASGILPIFASQEAQQLAASNPLTVALSNLELDLQGLYEGGVSGNVVITGTALEPAIGGTIELSNGEVSIAQGAATNGAITPTEEGEDATTPGGLTAGALPPIEFTGLELILGDNVRVTQQPLLSFTARGDININGTLADPRPQGEVRIVGGQVNLFTTQFTLARGYEQTAQFTPSEGLDPILDVRLVAIVPEVSGTPTRALTSPISSEIRDADVIAASSLGTLRTVRVVATAMGPASELSENLELTSEPSRTEEEIVALIGGTYVNLLGQQDAALGIATLAGSTLLGGVQQTIQGTITEIGQVIGLSEFRVFPTIVSDEESEVSVLGLAGEAVFDITQDLSLSLSRVFIADEPFRYNVLYRLNDDILVRGSTNLGDEGRVLVQYENRF